jgi:hypothetical protein
MFFQIDIWRECVGRELMAKMTNAKFKVEKMNGKNNFELWKLKMRELLATTRVDRWWWSHIERKKNYLLKKLFILEL